MLVYILAIRINYCVR